MVKTFVDAIDILDALVLKVGATVQSLDAWDKSSNPHEETITVRHKNEYWIAYTGSTYSEGVSAHDEAGNATLIQMRELEFASYVTVIDLRNSHRAALALHQLIMGTLNGTLPITNFDGIKTPLTIKSDVLLAPRGAQTTFRYEAKYKIQTTAIVTDDNGAMESFTQVIADIWKSDADRVAEPAFSILDARLTVKSD